MKTKLTKSIKMERKCTECQNNYTRSYCDFCRRAKKWDPSKYKIELSPRIQKDLKEIEIEVNPNELIFLRTGGSLFLTGATGSGKTLYSINVLLASLRLTFIKQFGPRVHKFITVTNLLEEIKKSFDEDSETDPIGFYSEVDFLVLDDLGVEKITDWSLEKLYQIINHRYEFLKPTVFTSNLDLKELSDKLGDRIPSRINQISMIKKFKETDYRLK